MRWSDFEQAQPRLARLGRERLLDPGVVLVVTIRRDGTPRLSGDQYAVLWPSGRHFVRRGTSATTIGDPEPAGDLLT